MAIKSIQRPARRTLRRGATLVFVIVSMLVLMGFCSLAVDLGRVQACKTELERAASAAARAGAANISGGVTAAQNAAVTMAAANLANGSSVVISPTSDVIFGAWNTSSHTFTTLTGSAQSGANAIKVTASLTAAKGNAVPLLFAQLIGQSGCNVTCSVIACTATGSTSPVGFVGLSGISAGNNANFDSYDSANGQPTNGSTTSSALVGSNSSISFGNKAEIDGDVELGPSGSVSTGNKYTLSGDTTTESSNLSYNATESPTVGASASVSDGNNATITLPGGTYNYADINAGNGFTLTFTGVATLYITSSFSVGNNATINAYQNIPSNLQIRMVGSASMSSGNNLTMTGEIYGPSASFSTGNGVEVNGSLIVDSISAGNTAWFNQDTEITSSGGGGASSTGISVVQ